jgi:LEA14-like dessication related protein
MAHTSLRTRIAQSPLARTRTAVPASLALALVVIMSMAGGCSSYSAPVVESVGASSPRIADEGSGVVVDFDVNLRNKNDEGLPLRTVDYTLDLDGQRVFRGTRSAEATVPATGTQRVELPVSFPAEKMRPGAKYRLTGTMTYVIPGAFAEALFDSGVRVPSMSFAAEGELAN